MTDEIAAAKAEAVVAFLRRAADRIEAGELGADAALIVVSEGDIHRPGRIGYRDDMTFIHARGAFYSYRFDTTSPEEQAEWRAEQERQRQATADAYEREHPWQCVCDARFKTHRGWTSHRGAMRRRSWERPEVHATVTEVAGPEPEPPVQLFPGAS